MAPLKILLKIPTRGRGLTHIYQWHEHCDDPENVEVIISIDSDELDEVNADFVHYISWLTFPKIRMYDQPRVNKIHAFNRDIEKAETDWDILVCGQDDLEVMPGWDTIIREAFKDRNLDKAIWFDTETDALFNDKRAYPQLFGIKRGDARFFQRFICMHPVMGRTLYERMGYVYNPVYQNFACDNEYTLVLRTNSRLQYTKATPFLHRHASYPDAMFGADATYTEAARTFRQDSATFQKRKALLQKKWKN